MLDRDMIWRQAHPFEVLAIELNHEDARMSRLIAGVGGYPEGWHAVDVHRR